VVNLSLNLRHLVPKQVLRLPRQHQDPAPGDDAVLLQAPKVLKAHPLLRSLPWNLPTVKKWQYLRKCPGKYKTTKGVDMFEKQRVSRILFSFSGIIII
jgi:hypothetical protein